MKSLLLLFGCLFSLIFMSNVHAAGVPLEYFGRVDCAHCQDQKAFLNNFVKEYPQVQVRYYDVATKEGAKLFEAVTGKAKLSKTTPLTFVGNTFIQGFRSPETTGERMKKLVKASIFKETLTLEQYLQAGIDAHIESVAGGSCTDNVKDCEDEDTSLIFDIPFLGSVNLKNASLLTLSVVLGFIDGFNPCAMWVLVMFLMVLLQVGNKVRMMQIAGAFIIAEAVMYYMILNVWMTTWNFVGLNQWVTPIVGLISLGGGLFFLWEAYMSDGTCQVTNMEQKKKISKKVQSIAENPLTWLSFFAIVGLAFSVNIIEFACSIGIPQAFTKVLDINMLSWVQKQWYMFWYILLYMADDFLVFGIAIYSFEKLGTMHEYSRITNFIGGMLMLIIGVLMIAKPELLVF